MNKTYLYVAAGIIFIALVGGVIFLSNNSTNTPRANQVPVDIELKDYEGNPVSLADYIGKPIVINSWAVWCPFCVEELKEFSTVQNELGSAVVIIAINRAESISRVKSFTDDLGVTDDLIFLLDGRDAFYKKIGGFSMPETIFVNAEGNIVIHKRGPMKASEIKDKIQSIL